MEKYFTHNKEINIYYTICLWSK